MPQGRVTGKILLPAVHVVRPGAGQHQAGRLADLVSGPVGDPEFPAPPSPDIDPAGPKARCPVVDPLMAVTHQEDPGLQGRILRAFRGRCQAGEELQGLGAEILGLVRHHGSHRVGPWIFPDQGASQGAGLLKGDKAPAPKAHSELFKQWPQLPPALPAEAFPPSPAHGMEIFPLSGDPLGQDHPQIFLPAETVTGQGVIVKAAAGLLPAFPEDRLIRIDDLQIHCHFPEIPGHPGINAGHFNPGQQICRAQEPELGGQIAGQVGGEGGEQQLPGGIPVRPGHQGHSPVQGGDGFACACRAPDQGWSQAFHGHQFLLAGMQEDPPVGQLRVQDLLKFMITGYQAHGSGPVGA